MPYKGFMDSEDQKVLDRLFKEIRHACSTCHPPKHLSKDDLELILKTLRGATYINNSKGNND